MQFEEYRKLQQETTIEELKVSYVVYGEGTPLLLIHGIPVWGYLWKDLLCFMFLNAAHIGKPGGGLCAGR